MKDTKIRWAEHTWNPMTGCTKVSPGCDHCYADVIANKFRGSAFPNGFEPTWKPQKLNDPRRWAPGRVFTNSMSDVFHPAFDTPKIDAVFQAMIDHDHHDYLVLTKRPKRMALWVNDWLDRTGRTEVPSHIWLGTSIENNDLVWRADHLRAIPVPVRFVSLEPLLSPLPDLNLDGLGWVIVGGESGPGYRPMDHQWARDLRDRVVAHPERPAFFFKQSAAPRTEMGIELDGAIWEEYPFPHPGDLPTTAPRTRGVFTGRHAAASIVDGVRAAYGV